MKRLLIFFLLLLSFRAWGQDVGKETSKLLPFIQTLHQFSRIIPQEKVYLHFDNTSYYQGDNIWFKCYVVSSGEHQLSDLSKTLYVELLNPGGEVVAKRILRIENGQCHGDFTLNQLPFYSGFYEVRAYTKYMLNFGDDIIFSRLFPVFEKPKEEGNYEEKEILGYGNISGSASSRYPMKRERPERGKAVNLRFFPEGGNLIQGITSRIAFEATDEAGNPIDIAGVVMDENKQTLCQFATLHEGRGVFIYTPDGANTNRQKPIVEVEYSGRKYQFDLPASLPQGVVMEVDNLSYPDSIGITLRKNTHTPAEMLGVTVLSGGKLQKYLFAWIADDEISFNIDKTQLPSGVSQIVLFNSAGEILCDRLIFTNKHEFLDIKAKTAKPVYRPYELVDMEFSVADKEANPFHTTFSLSVRDAANEVENTHTILTELLLMSEIKGYVRNPLYYFEENDDDTRRTALDLLLMVQGWRRYSWKQMTGVEDFDVKYLPEQGIETYGNVVFISLFGKKHTSKPNVDVSLLLQKREEGDETSSGLFDSFLTDDKGRFSFVSDVSGRWNMILSVKDKGKRKNYQILLDKTFSPEPRRYRYVDLQAIIAEKTVGNIMNDEETPEDIEDDYATFLIAYQDSLAKLGIEEKTTHLTEATITAKRRTKEGDILHNRSTSAIYYDVASEYDDIYDRGEFIGDDIYQLLVNMNDDFSIGYYGRKHIFYKGRKVDIRGNAWTNVLFVINYEKVNYANSLDIFKYEIIRLSAIKSIYINENKSAIAQYVYHPNRNITSQELAEMFRCVVFIETYPGDDTPFEGTKGVRKTWLEGYSVASEFYSPNYSELPPEHDYRRTLYWNPAVIPDENGKAKITFYNNSSCRNFSISAETVTSEGMIGVYKRE